VKSADLHEGARVEVRRFYLGVPVDITRSAGTGWVWATWPDGREFKHWAEQLTETPFNTPQSEED
jgi:hypothetical protein